MAREIYHVVECPRCGYIFITRAKLTTRCRTCGRTFSTQKNQIGRGRSLYEAKKIFYQHLIKTAKDGWRKTST